MSLEEMAFLYAFGALNDKERAQLKLERGYDKALDKRIDEAEGMMAPLALDPKEAPVPDALWDRLESAIAKEETTHVGVATNLLGEGQWRRLRPKVEMKALWDGNSFLVRCEPGAKIRAHDHLTEERMMIVSGSAQVGEQVLQAGDCQVSAAGSRHAEISAPGGCVFFVQMMKAAA